MRYWKEKPLQKELLTIVSVSGHTQRRPNNHILQRALEYQIPTKKKVGRPCLTWNDSFQTGIEIYTSTQSNKQSRGHHGRED
jgi:hypothetical protein